MGLFYLLEHEKLKAMDIGFVFCEIHRKLEFKCDFKKSLVLLREAAEQLTKIVIGDLCFAIGPSFFCEENEKKHIHWKLILAHIHPNQIKLDVLSSSSPNLESFLFTSDKTFQ